MIFLAIFFLFCRFPFFIYINLFSFFSLVVCSLFCQFNLLLETFAGLPEPPNEVNFCVFKSFIPFTGKILDYRLAVFGLKMNVVLFIMASANFVCSHYELKQFKKGTRVQTYTYTLMNDFWLAGINCVTRFIVIAHGSFGLVIIFFLLN